MDVTVVIPSNRPDWVVAAVRVANSQSVRPSAVIVGADPDGIDKVAGATVVRARRHGQAHAMNAAASHVQTPVLAFLEDDDSWHRERLESALKALESGADLVTSNQVVLGKEGMIDKVVDFPTPSSWVMRTETWCEVGPMEARYRYFLDKEWIARFNATGLNRVHQLAPDEFVNSRARRRISRHADIQVVDVDALVMKTEHEDSLTARANASPHEHARRLEERRTLNLEHSRDDSW